ncbi:hypothetical protein HNP55_003010 [Paucibacter oligotrophus]|uniref:Uncharacterized protein n=1 Tax=Roseateles oligotrophus TaxID=1769250 RepID=A0A840L8Q7_9BURK|nr:hypothetical protein [Roseateles oligotrophus]MBB4844466.1 hypothetical protein [Roseateles oligotrophus]
MESVRTVAKYHADRIRNTIKGSDPRNHRYEYGGIDDPQATKLMLALEVRRLAELLVVADAWEKLYDGDEKKFINVGMNDLLDVMGRAKRWGMKLDDIEGGGGLLAKIPQGRFKLRYMTAGGKTNEQLRRNADSVFQFIFAMSSKVLHADEYSVQNHCTDDPHAWTSLVMVADLVLGRYDDWVTTHQPSESASAHCAGSGSVSN